MTEMNDTSGRWSYARQLYGHVYTAKIGTLSELVPMQPAPVVSCVCRSLAQLQARSVTLTMVRH